MRSTVLLAAWRSLAPRLRSSLLANRPFRCLLLVQVIFGVCFGAFFILPKHMVTRLGASPAQLGVTMAAFALGAVLAARFIRPLTRRLGPGICLALGAATMAVGSFLFLGVHSPGGLAIVARAAQGAASIMVFSIGGAVAADLTPPERRSEALALFVTAGSLANTFVPAVAEHLIEIVGPGLVFGAAGVAALASLIPCRQLIRATPHLAGLQPARDLTTSLQPQRLPRPAPAITGLLCIAIVFGLASGVMFTYYQPFAYAVGIRRVADFIIAFTLTVCSLRLAAGGLIDRIGSLQVARWSFVAYAAALASMVWLRPGRLALFGVLIGVFHGAFFPSLMTLVIDSGGHRGSRAAWMNASMNVGGLGVAAIGPWAARFGYPSAFLGVAAVVAVSAALLWSKQSAPMTTERLSFQTHRFIYAVAPTTRRTVDEQAELEAGN